MALKEITHSMRVQVDQEIGHVINQPEVMKFEGFRSMLAYHLGWEGEGTGPGAQGKKIRPIIVLLSAGAVSGNWEKALPAASAVELIHNFSLIHDDIQDGSPLRHGRPTVWTKWGAAQAINAGDLMFTLAFQAALRLEETCQPHVALRAQQLLQQTCIALTQGQYLDLHYETLEDVSVDDYWTMVRGKTAALLACSAEIGALVGGANAQVQKKLHDYGVAVGLAFQAWDDWLGIWGDIALTGKSTDSDLVAGKKSLPVVFGLAHNGEFARRWRAGKTRPEDVQSMAELLSDEGAQAYTVERVETFTKQAIDLLSEAIQPNQFGNALIELTYQLLNRKK